MFPRWRVFPVLALGTVMATLDISVVNVALPTLSRAFRAPLTTSEWVVLGYVLTLTALLLALGRVADAIGRRRMYGAGLALFTLASLACAAAPGLGALIGARVLQGVGAAMMSSTSLALLTSSFPDAERGRAIGAFGAAVGVGLALGPPLGGLVVEHASWRWIFALHLPLGLATLAMVRSRLPADAHPPHAPRLDPVAIPASVAALVAVMLALSRGPVDGWRSAGVLGLLAAGAVLSVVFALRERRASAPLLPLDLLGGPLGRALLLTLIGQVLSIAVGLHMPLYLEEVLGFGPGTSGRWLAVLPLTALVLAPLAGRWSDRVGGRILVASGLFVLGLGVGALATLGTRPGTVHLGAALALVGIGLGVFSVANSSSLMGSVPAERLGTAGGLQATARNLGLAAGSALIVALVASRFTAHGGGPRLLSGALGDAQKASLALATRDAYAVLAVLAVAASGWALRTPRNGRRD